MGRVRVKRSCLAIAVFSASLAMAEPPAGFFADSVEAHLEAEEVLLATPAPDKAKRWLAALTEEPHRSRPTCLTSVSSFPEVCVASASTQG